MTRTVWWAAAAGVAVLGSTILTGGDALLQVCVVVYAASVVAAFLHPVVALAATLVVLLVRVSLVADMDVLPVDIRYLVAPFVAALVLRSVGRSGGRWDLLRLTLPTVAVFALLSVAWSISPTDTANAALGLVAAAAVCLAARRVLTVDQVTRVVATLGWVAVGLSLVALWLMPEVAMEGGRVRGVFVNANGFSAFLVVVAPILLTRLQRWRWPAAVMLVVVCVATGSRAGFVALVLQLVILAVGDRRPMARIGGVVGTAVAGYVFVAVFLTSRETPALMLLRNNDSRSDFWQRGWAYFEAHPTLGVGVGALPANSSAGLAPELLATYGIVGTAIVAVFLAVLLFTTARCTAMVAALIVGGLADAVFEPWLFAGSVYCVIFWLIVYHRPVHVLVEPGRNVAQFGKAKVDAASG